MIEYPVFNAWRDELIKKRWPRIEQDHGNEHYFANA